MSWCLLASGLHPSVAGAGAMQVLVQLDDVQSGRAWSAGSCALSRSAGGAAESCERPPGTFTIVIVTCAILKMSLIELLLKCNLVAVIG